MSHDIVQRFRKKLKNLSDYSGLKSPGLTCYLNSVLQVLFMTEDFREAVKRCCNQDSATIDPHLVRLFSELETCTAKTRNITKQLGITNVYEQRDAAEYLEKILCMTSLEASKIFRGQLSHKITCCMCEKVSNSESFFWILPLSVEDFCVRKGLEAFCTGEIVSGMHCDHCNIKGDATLRCEITQNPEILTVLLKRFSFDFKRNCYVKLECHVDVPQTLQTEVFRNCTYDLYALVDHFGNLTGGHYTAQIKSYENGKWYHFDDTSVEKVRKPLFGAGNASFRSCTAYLLMYRKVKRQQSGRPTGDNPEAHLANSDDDAEGRRDGSAWGEDPVHHNKMRDNSRNRERDLKQNEIGDDLVQKKQTCRTGACVSPGEEVLLHRDAAITDEDACIQENGFNFQTPKPKDNIRRMLEQTVKGMPCNVESSLEIPQLVKDREQISNTEYRRGKQQFSQSKEHMCHLNTRGSHVVIFGKPSVSSRADPSANRITWDACEDNVTNNAKVSCAERNVTVSVSRHSVKPKGKREAVSGTRSQQETKGRKAENPKETKATKNKPPWK